MKALTLILAMIAMTVLTQFAQASEQEEISLSQQIQKLDAQLQDYAAKTGQTDLLKGLAPRSAPAVTPQDFLQKAKASRETAVHIGDYLYEQSNWDRLPKTERDYLIQTETEYLNVSTDLVTCSVGLVLDESFGHSRTNKNICK